MTEPQNNAFTSYQKFAIFILAITQFTVILDFMVMAPLGDLLLKSLDMNTKDFSIAVSAYAFSAGIAGLLTAGFADRFDRKKLLLFFYVGFIIGTLFCALANSYTTLVLARIVTGLFGGVIGSISMAIITDLFSLQQRGRVMGYVQMGFGASQVLGIPIGLYIANKWYWEAPFFMIVGLSILIAFAIAIYFKPVTEHLKLQQNKKVVAHLWHTLKHKDYRIGFLSICFLSVGGFMLMPFGTIFAVNNLGVHPDQLPILFMISGISSLALMPFIGKLSDRMDKYRLFTLASIWLMTVSVVYTNLFQIPFWLVVTTNILMMIGIMSRMVPATALSSAIPYSKDRGAYMSISSSIQQISGGIAATISGLIVYQESATSPLINYDKVAYMVIIVSCISIFLMGRINRLVQQNR